MTPATRQNKRRPKAADAPLGDQNPTRDEQPSKGEAKILAEQGDPARRPDAPGTEVVESTPEQDRASELQAKREKLGVGHIVEQPVHHRLEVAREFDGVDGGKLTVSTAKGQVTFRSDRNVKFDADGLHTLRVFLDSAAQAVA